MGPEEIFKNHIDDWGYASIIGDCYDGPVENIYKAMEEYARIKACQFAERMEGRSRLENGNWRLGHLLEETTEEAYRKYN